MDTDVSHAVQAELDALEARIAALESGRLVKPDDGLPDEQTEQGEEYDFGEVVGETEQ